jgi:mono/diheme cytochrome c family protein
MSAARVAVALAVVVVFGLAVAGTGAGSAPKGDHAPSATAVAAAKQRLAASPPAREGAEEFESEGCDACHAIAATGAKGELGPRLDTVGDSVHEDVENIEHPRKDIAEGYEDNAKLMPTDYAKRMSPHELKAVGTFIKTVSGAEGEEKEAGGGG